MARGISIYSEYLKQAEKGSLAVAEGVVEIMCEHFHRQAEGTICLAALATEFAGSRHPMENRLKEVYEDFIEAGAEVIGISSDSAESHKNFANHHRLPFTLLSDPDKKVRKAFNVPTNLFGLLPGRVTYIVDKKGIIRHIFNSQFNIDKHISEALNILRKLNE